MEENMNKQGNIVVLLHKKSHNSVYTDTYLNMWINWTPQTAPKSNQIVYKIKHCIKITGYSATQRLTHKQKYKHSFKYYIGRNFTAVCELITIFVILLFTFNSVHLGLQLLNTSRRKKWDHRQYLMEHRIDKRFSLGFL